MHYKHGHNLISHHFQESSWVLLKFFFSCYELRQEEPPTWCLAKLPWIMWYLWKVRKYKLFKGSRGLTGGLLTKGNSEMWGMVCCSRSYLEWLIMRRRMGCTYQGVKWMHLGRPISQLLVDVLFWNEEMEMLSQVFSPFPVEFNKLLWAMCNFLHMSMKSMHFEWDCLQMAKLIGKKKDFWPLFYVHFIFSIFYFSWF